jgi:hypothetical protein
MPAVTCPVCATAAPAAQPPGPVHVDEITARMSIPEEARTFDLGPGIPVRSTSVPHTPRAGTGRPV